MKYLQRMKNKNAQIDSQSTNIWSHKPWWCQPWSIILTGITIVSASWLLIHQLWLTLGVSGIIAVWWIYFLSIYPQAFAEYIKRQSQELNDEA